MAECGPLASLPDPFAVIIDELGETMKTGSDVSALIETLRHQVEGALDRMANGFKLSGARRS